MIKQLKSTDEKEILEIAHLMIELFPQAYHNPKEVSDELKDLATPPNLLFASFDQAHVTGAIGAILQYGTTGYELHPLVVHKAYQKKGIGSKLMVTLEKAIIEQGGIMVYLGSDDEFDQTTASQRDLYQNLSDWIETIDSKTHPLNFYRKHGYHVTGLIPDANGFGKPDIILAKRLVDHPFPNPPLMKKRFPILEWDSQKKALIEPSFVIDKYPKLPQKLIITFFYDVLMRLLEEKQIQHAFTLRGENTLDIYTFVDEDIAIIHGKLGGPACAGFLDELIALGAKDIMFCGGGGALREDLSVGKLIVVKEAIRDEGTSYHYVKPSRIIEANPQVYQHIMTTLDNEGVAHMLGRVWTTDAFFRETPDKIQLRMEEEALVVEMEQASMIAVAQFRNVLYGAIIYAGDDVSKETWDSRNWHNREDIRYHLVGLCKTIVSTL